MNLKYRIISIILVFIVLLGVYDYQRYFYGKSFINYHVLPYNLTPKFIHDHIMENEKTVDVNMFYIVNDNDEYLGPGSAIPTNSYYSKFMIKTISGYYYKNNDLLIICCDNDNRKHTLKLFYNDNAFFYDEIHTNDLSDLKSYKFISIEE